MSTKLIECARAGVNTKVLLHFHTRCPKSRSVMTECEYFLTFTQHNRRSAPSSWWLYQLKACVRSGVIHLTLNRTWGPAIQTHRRHQLPRSPLFTPFSMPHKSLAPRLPTYSPLSLSFSCLVALPPSFTHSSPRTRSLHLFH